MQQQPIGKGLDIGTANLLSAVQDANGNITVKKQRNAFVDVPLDAHQKAMLTRLKVPYVVQGKQMYVLGDAAFELANVLNKNTRRPMASGLISPKESAAVPVMKLLIESLIGKPAVVGEPLFFSVPGVPIDVERNVIYHRDVFQAILREMGYAAQEVNEGHAVVLSELANDDFTGIGISFCGGMGNVCVSYRSMPALTFAVSRGGDWVDQNVANVLGIKPAKATMIKESGFDVTKPQNREQEAVSIYLSSMVNHVLTAIAERFRMADDMPSFNEPVPVVLAGGTPMIPGFAKLVEAEFAKIDFPIPVKEVRVAPQPLHAIARGCLMMAMTAEADPSAVAAPGTAMATAAALAE